MLIDFVPTVAGVSLAEVPAFKKASGGAPENVAVGISGLGVSSAFIGKVSLSTVYVCILFNTSVTSLLGVCTLISTEVHDKYYSLAKS